MKTLAIILASATLVGVGAGSVLAIQKWFQNNQQEKVSTSLNIHFSQADQDKQREETQKAQRAKQISIDDFVQKKQPQEESHLVTIQLPTNTVKVTTNAPPKASNLSAEELYKKALESESYGEWENLQHAKELYETLIKQYPTSPYADKAAERNAELGPKIAAAYARMVDEMRRRARNINGY